MGFGKYGKCSVLTLDIKEIFWIRNLVFSTSIFGIQDPLLVSIFFLFQIQRPRRTSNRELVGITRFVVIKRTRVHERLQYSNHIGDFNIEKNLSFSELERILFFGAFAFVCIRLYLPEHRMEIFVPKMHFSECLSSRVSTQFNWIYLLCAIRQPIVIVLTLFLLVCSPFFGLLPHIYPTDASIWMWTSRSKIAKEA